MKNKYEKKKKILEGLRQEAQSVNVWKDGLSGAKKKLTFNSLVIPRVRRTAPSLDCQLEHVFAKASSRAVRCVSCL